MLMLSNAHVRTLIFMTNNIFPFVFIDMIIIGVTNAQKMYTIIKSYVYCKQKKNHHTLFVLNSFNNW